jgi:hypothetical protein
MKCPICGDHRKIEINIHSEGYADNLLECSTCEASWIESLEACGDFKTVILTHNSNYRSEQNNV